MSADTNAAWRGVAAEKADEVSAGLAALLRERSRRLLGDLLRPYRRAVIATISLIVVQSLAALAGPWLVGIAIDNGLPPLLHDGDPAPLLGIAAAFAVAVAVQAVTTRMFVTMTGQIGQKIVLELRRRLFAHFLRLDVAFHEDYKIESFSYDSLSGNAQNGYERVRQGNIFFAGEHTSVNFQGFMVGNAWTVPHLDNYGAAYYW